MKLNNLDDQSGKSTTPSVKEPDQVLSEIVDREAREN